MYEISETVTYCNDRFEKAYYSLEKFNGADNDPSPMMIDIKTEQERQYANWRKLIREEMDDRRLEMGKFLRYNIH